MLRMPIMPNTSVSPEATRNSSIPYTTPCSPCVAYTLSANIYALPT